MLFGANARVHDAWGAATGDARVLLREGPTVSKLVANISRISSVGHDSVQVVTFDLAVPAPVGPSLGENGNATTNITCKLTSFTATQNAKNLAAVTTAGAAVDVSLRAPALAVDLPLHAMSRALVDGDCFPLNVTVELPEGRLYNVTIELEDATG